MFCWRQFWQHRFCLPAPRRETTATIRALVLAQATDSTSASGEDVNTNLTEAGTFPIVKERVEISVFTHPTPEKKVDSYKSEDNKFTAWYEEYTNVKLNFIMAPSAADITTSLSTLMSSGEMPDILLSNNFTPEQQQLYGEQGTILEITELVEKNAPRIKKWWDENPEIKDAVTFSGDRTYAINYETTNPRDMVWNKNVCVISPGWTH